METREEILFIILRKRLEHATASDNERRELIKQQKLRDEEQSDLVSR